MLLTKILLQILSTNYVITAADNEQAERIKKEGENMRRKF